jgi:GTP:adenosylcobinamide-phosphate guanylyltransferase/thiamine kinase-like enzyme
MHNNPLVILAAGRGSRLGAFTSAVNKGLLPIKDKAVISHIIDKAPTDSEVIIALGYQGDKVRDYCLIAHPQRKFIFVEVENYDGPGSGPGHSMMCCKKYLNRPFYFCTVDCIVSEDLPDLKNNWIGVSKTDDPQAFSTAKLCWNQTTDVRTVLCFVNKRPSGFDHAFIGLAGITDFAAFWDDLSANMHEKETELVSAFYDPIKMDLRAFEFTWLDTGTIDNYAKTKRHFEGSQEFDFDKVGEFTYIVNGRVIKYFDDKTRVEKRVARASKMRGVPPVIAHRDNFFAYEFVPGHTLYEEECVDSDSLFKWLQKNLWEWKDEPSPVFEASCMKFYKDKTLERYEMYKKKKSIVHDSPSTVNGVSCEAMECYLEKVDWSSLSQGIPVIFHGDLQFDNIIKKTDGGYLLLDWRDCFANQLEVGDLYYDLAKLNGGFLLPYNLIKSGAFFCRTEGSHITFDYQVDPKIKKMREEFDSWRKSMAFDSRVDLLTTLIYLNMSPLHTEPFDELLFNLAKLRFQEHRNAICSA